MKGTSPRYLKSVSLAAPRMQLLLTTSQQPLPRGTSHGHLRLDLGDGTWQGHWVRIMPNSERVAAGRKPLAAPDTELWGSCD